MLIDVSSASIYTVYFDFGKLFEIKSIFLVLSQEQLANNNNNNFNHYHRLNEQYNNFSLAHVPVKPRGLKHLELRIFSFSLFFSGNARKHTSRVNYRASQMSNYIFIAPILPLSPQN